MGWFCHDKDLINFLSSNTP
jgi:hypothetical protein